jgi:hypothetical protein
VSIRELLGLGGEVLNEGPELFEAVHVRSLGEESHLEVPNALLGAEPGNDWDSRGSDASE